MDGACELSKEFLVATECWFYQSLLNVVSPSLKELLLCVKLQRVCGLSPPVKLIFHCGSKELVKKLWDRVEEIALAVYQLRPKLGQSLLPHFVFYLQGKPASPLVNPLVMLSVLAQEDSQQHLPANQPSLLGEFMNLPLVFFNPNVLESFPLFGKIDDFWLGMAMEIHQEQKPCFLVSMDLHRNILFNEAAVKLLNTTSEKLLAKSLPKFWVPPQEIQPVDYDANIPQQLTDFNSLLRGNSLLYSHRYEGWREDAQAGTATWGTWVDDIEYKELPLGGNARKMVVLDWISTPSSTPLQRV